MSIKTIAIRYPVACYCILTYFISWLGAGLLLLPHWTNNTPVQKMDGLLMFPVMLTGPVIASLLLTGITKQKAGWRDIGRRMKRYKLPAKWYALAMLLPPVLITLVLVLLGQFSPVFKLNFFWPGLFFGIPAGFFEEIGWTGFAKPALLTKHSIPVTGVVLGLMWGLWHLPVIDFLGAAWPHGHYLLLFMTGFIVLLMGIRLIMTWAYAHTQSILLMQLMHAVSTGSLVLLGPMAVSPAQEALWYVVYAATVWIVIVVSGIIFSAFIKKKQL